MQEISGVFFPGKAVPAGWQRVSGALITAPARGSVRESSRHGVVGFQGEGTAAIRVLDAVPQAGTGGEYSNFQCPAVAGGV